MMTIGVYSLLFLLAAIVAVGLTSAVLSLRSIFLATCWMPLAALVLALMFPDWLTREFGYGVLILLAFIVVFSGALTFLGALLIANSTTAAERWKLSAATLLAASAAIICSILFLVA
jgi:hypothetical protein